MIERIESAETPSFIFLRYNTNWHITSLFAVHKFFITTSVVQRSNALSQSAIRRDWVGCNILVGDIPADGKISIVDHGVVTDRSEVRAKFRMAGTLEQLTPPERGWTALTLQLLRRLGLQEFELNDAYHIESEFERFYPQNRHIRAKIRQQLQVLRDLGFIQFIGRARYRFTA
jgi:type II restriction enzyme